MHVSPYLVQPSTLHCHKALSRLTPRAPINPLAKQYSTCLATSCAIVGCFTSRSCCVICKGDCPTKTLFCNNLKTKGHKAQPTKALEQLLKAAKQGAQLAGLHNNHLPNRVHLPLQPRAYAAISPPPQPPKAAKATHLLQPRQVHKLLLPRPLIRH